METAQAVAARHDGLEVVIEEGVGESRYGDWTGQSIKELAKTPEWLQVQFTPGLARFPNGESLGEMQARAVAAVERLRRLHPSGAMAIFSHADVIKARGGLLRRHALRPVPAAGDRHGLGDVDPLHAPRPTAAAPERHWRIGAAQAGDRQRPAIAAGNRPQR